MGFDESLADRVRRMLTPRRGFVEKRMFGGIGFLRRGNLCVAVWREHLIMRVGPDQYKQALAEPGARKFDVTGREMRGWVMVAGEAFELDDDLKEWVQRAERFV